jgi:hypothetical protein
MDLGTSAGKFNGNAKRSTAVWQLCGFCLLLLFVFSALPTVWAQTGYATGTVRGTVFDAQGAVVPKATVTIRNPSTGATRGVVTSPDGTYQVSSLNPGTYTVEVDAQGFNKLIADEVVVTVGQVVVYDGHLKSRETLRH